MSKVFIYTLVDPREPNNIRYVGKAKNLKNRLRWHIVEAKDENSFSYKNNWIRILLKDNIKPLIEEVDYVEKEQWGFWEQFYIELFEQWGFKLTNLATGGNTGDYKDGVGAIKKMVKARLEKLRNKKLSDEDVDIYLREKEEKIEAKKIKRKLRDDELTIYYINKISGKVLGEARGSIVLGKILGINPNKIQECLNGKTYVYYKGQPKPALSYKGYVFVRKKDFDPEKDYRVKYKRNREY